MEKDIKTTTKNESTEDNKKIKFGFDIGTASIGWAVLEINNGEESSFDNAKIIASGVRLFDEPLESKTREPLNTKRRESRLMRNRLRRRRGRLDDVRNLFIKGGFCSRKDFEIDETSKLGDKKNIFQRRILNSESVEQHNIFRLRVKALDDKLSIEELVSVLYNIAKRRGFKSTKKEKIVKEQEVKQVDEKLIDGKQVKEKKEKKPKEGDQQVLNAISKMTQEIASINEEHKYQRIRTIVEYLVYKYDRKEITSFRNKVDSYNNSLLREAKNSDLTIKKELELIFAKQKEYYGDKITDSFIKKYEDIVFFQRRIPSVANMVGKCSLEKSEYRAAKYSPSAEKFIALSKLITIRIEGGEEGERKLKEDEIATILQDSLTRKDTTYKNIRKKLKLPEEYSFKGLSYKSKLEGVKVNDKAEDNKLYSFEGTKDLEKFFSNLAKEEDSFKAFVSVKGNEKLYDRFVQIFALYQDRKERAEKLKEEQVFSDLQIETILESEEFDFKNFIDLSHKALYKILDHLGKRYYNENTKQEELAETTKAIESAGYERKDTTYKANSIKLPAICKVAKLEDFYMPKNPVVIRTTTQFIKTFNALLKKYGVPDCVNIELLRELTSPSSKAKHTVFRDDNQELNQKAKEKCEEFGISPTLGNFLKVKLWEEQNHICPYCIKGLEVSAIKDCEVDHIFPHSISLDNSQNNKVLVHSKCNQDKGQRTPYQAFASDEVKWQKIVGWVKLTSNGLNKNKKDRILSKKTNEEISEGFVNRQFNDTSYITTFIKDYIKYYFDFTEGGKKAKNKIYVESTKGGLTSILRQIFSLQKYRSIEDVIDRKKQFLIYQAFYNNKAIAQEVKNELRKLKLSADKNDKKEFAEIYKNLKDYLYAYFIGGSLEEKNPNDEDEESNSQEEAKQDKKKSNKQKKLEIPSNIKKYINEDNLVELKFKTNNEDIIHGLKEIEKDYIGDRHHAIDAVLIALSSKSLIKAASDLARETEEYIQGQLDTFSEEDKKNKSKEYKELLALKYKDSVIAKVKYLLDKNDSHIRQKLPIGNLEDFKEEMIGSINKIFVSRMVNCSIDGSIHMDTIYSPKKDKNNEGEERLTTRKKVKDLKEGDIAKILGSEKIKEEVRNWFQQENKNIFPRMPRKDGTMGDEIRMVTLVTDKSGASFVPLPKMGGGLVDNDKVVRNDIFLYEGQDKKGNAIKKYVFRPITLADIFIKKQASLEVRASSVLNKDDEKLISSYKGKISKKVHIYQLEREYGDNNFKFCFSLYKNDLIKIFLEDKKQEKRILTVYYNSFQNASLEYIFDDNRGKKTNNQQLVVSASQITNLEKYQVSYLGEITKINNHRYQSFAKLQKKFFKKEDFKKTNKEENEL